MTTERLEARRKIAASPAEIFAIVSDPAGHVRIDSTGMLMSASGARVTAVGETPTA